MIRTSLILALVGGVVGLSAQVPPAAFEVANVKPSPPTPPTRAPVVCVNHQVSGAP